MITRVTITGADRSIHPEQLAQFSEKYPFVEWGILASRKQMDSPRFPGSAWLLELARVKRKFDENHQQKMNLSLHLCGAYVREVFMGEDKFTTELPINLFDRIQLNTHGEPHEWNVVAVEQLMDVYGAAGKEFIFQYDNINTDLLETIAKRGKVTNFSALYDLSHGAGILPKQWPAPLAYCKTGYAGGLGPHNLGWNMSNIDEISIGKEVWIDMETRVRSGQWLENFDPENVHDALRIAEKCLKV